MRLADERVSQLPRPMRRLAVPPRTCDLLSNVSSSALPPAKLHIWWHLPHLRLMYPNHGERVWTFADPQAGQQSNADWLRRASVMLLGKSERRQYTRNGGRFERKSTAHCELKIVARIEVHREIPDGLS